MGAIFGSLASNLLEVLIFGVIAYAGIICGKKFRAHRDATSAVSDKKDTK